MSTPVTSKAMKHDLITTPTTPTPHPRSTKRSILGPLSLMSFTSVEIRRFVPKSTLFLEKTEVSVKNSKLIPFILYGITLRSDGVIGLGSKYCVMAIYF